LATYFWNDGIPFPTGQYMLPEFPFEQVQAVGAVTGVLSAALV
jgi:hypothetical protein